MAKIKLLESRASLTGCQKAGDVLEVSASDAKRMVGLYQAEYYQNDKATVKARAEMDAQPLSAVLESDNQLPADGPTDNSDDNELDTDPDDLIDDEDDEDESLTDGEENLSPTKTLDGEDDDEDESELDEEDDEIESLELDAKVIATLKLEFATITALADAIDNEFDLTGLNGIGKVTAAKIVETVDALYEDEDGEGDEED